MAADGKTPPTHPQGGAGTLCVHVVSLCADTKTMTCRPCLDTYIHTYKQTINQYKQIVIIHKSIETYSYTYTWLQMVRPPQPTHRGGAGTLCVHVVSLCADTKTMTCRPCWDTHILTYQQTDRQTHRHTYINQYKHIVIPIHGCICVTYPPFGGGGWGGTRGGWIIYVLMNSLDRFGLGPQVGSFSVDFFRATLAPPILQMHRELLKPKGPRESAVSGRIFKVCPNTSVVSPPSSTTSPNTWRPWISVNQTT